MLSHISRDQASVANYVCVSLTIIVLALRLFDSKFQPKPFDASFFVVVFSLLLLVARAARTYFTLTLDTGADAIHAAASNHPFTPIQLSHIKSSIIFSLINRALETTFWWSQSLVLLLLYRRLVSHIRWNQPLIHLTSLFMALSYLAVLLSIFLECRPFPLYYQVTPSPGTCNKGYVRTLLQCLSNIAIDAALITIALPVIVIHNRALRQRIRIAALIALGVFCTVVTCLRLAYIVEQGSFQPTRSFWAGIQILASGFVANAPVIYGSAKRWQRKGREGSGKGRDASSALTGTGRVRGEGGPREGKGGVVVEEQEEGVQMTRTFVVTRKAEEGDEGSEAELVV